MTLKYIYIYAQCVLVRNTILLDYYLLEMNDFNGLHV